MSDLYYRVGVANLTRGWGYGVEKDVKPALDATSCLADNLTYSWGWLNEQIPGHMTPSTMTVTIAATSASTLPYVELGDLVRVIIEVGDPLGGTTVPILIEVGRVTEAPATVTPGRRSRFKALLNLTVTGLLADLSSLSPPSPPMARQVWRERWAQIGAAAGISIGCPVGWPDQFENLTANGGPLDDGTGTETYSELLAQKWGDGTFADIAASLANSYAPYGVHCTLVPYLGGAYPFGYRYIGPDTWLSFPPQQSTTGPIPDPNSPIRYLLTAASRFLPPDWVEAQPTVSAAHCVVPATARRGREHQINLARLTGVAYSPALVFSGEVLADQNRASTRQYAAPSVATQGARSRDVATQRVLAYFDPTATGTPDTPYGPNPGTAQAGRVFLSDASVAARPFVFEGFKILSSKIPFTLAADLLPKLIPDATRPNGLVRHLTITDLDPAAQFDGPDVRGFLTKGSLSISRGQIAHNVTMTPGDPTGSPYVGDLP